MNNDNDDCFDETIYFEVNNWFSGRDYPASEPFYTWLNDMKGHKLADNKWAKENKLCIKYGSYDMSMIYFVTATKEWVEMNCPCLLQPENAKFICNPKNEGEEPIGWLGRKNNSFLEYKPENFGSIDLEETLNDWDPFGYYICDEEDEAEIEEAED